MPEALWNENVDDAWWNINNLRAENNRNRLIMFNAQYNKAFWKIARSQQITNWTKTCVETSIQTIQSFKHSVYSDFIIIILHEYKK